MQLRRSVELPNYDLQISFIYSELSFNYELWLNYDRAEGGKS